MFSSQIFPYRAWEKHVWTCCLFILSCSLSFLIWCVLQKRIKNQFWKWMIFFNAQFLQHLFLSLRFAQRTMFGFLLINFPHLYDMIDCVISDLLWIYCQDDYFCEFVGIKWTGCFCFSCFLLQGHSEGALMKYLVIVLPWMAFLMQPGLKLPASRILDHSTDHKVTPAPL